MSSPLTSSACVHQAASDIVPVVYVTVEDSALHRVA